MSVFAEEISAYIAAACREWHQQIEKQLQFLMANFPGLTWEIIERQAKPLDMPYYRAKNERQWLYVKFDGKGRYVVMNVTEEFTETQEGFLGTVLDMLDRRLVAVHGSDGGRR